MLQMFSFHFLISLIGIRECFVISGHISVQACNYGIHMFQSNLSNEMHLINISLASKWRIEANAWFTNAEEHTTGKVDSFGPTHKESRMRKSSKFILFFKQCLT